MPSTGKASGYKPPVRVQSRPPSMWKDLGLALLLFMSLWGSFFLGLHYSGTLNSTAISPASLPIINGSIGMVGSPTIPDAVLPGTITGTITHGPLTVPATVWADTSVPALSRQATPGPSPSIAARKTSAFFFVAPATPTATVPASTTTATAVPDTTEPAMPPDAPLPHIAVVINWLQSAMVMSACKVGLPDCQHYGEINLETSSFVTSLFTVLCNPRFLVSGALAMSATGFLACLMIFKVPAQRTIFGFKQASLRRKIASVERSRVNLGMLLGQAQAEEWRLSRKLTEAHGQLDAWVSRGAGMDRISAQLRANAEALTQQLETVQAAVLQLRSERAAFVSQVESLQARVKGETKKARKLELSVQDLRAKMVSNDEASRASLSDMAHQGAQNEILLVEEKEALLRRIAVLEDSLRAARVCEQGPARAIDNNNSASCTGCAELEGKLDNLADLRKSLACKKCVEAKFGKIPAALSPASTSVNAMDLSAPDSARSRVNLPAAGSSPVRKRRAASSPPSIWTTPDGLEPGQGPPPKTEKRKRPRSKRIRDSDYYAARKEKSNAKKARRAAQKAAEAEGTGEGASDLQDHLYTMVSILGIAPLAGMKGGLNLPFIQISSATMVDYATACSGYDRLDPPGCS
ncbi:hypothetical protein K490DRAFT_53440 [Saccharata proteae CBS 121410]|uniref:Uncharacterized protein n=1 Tax=Saccharata proteae CBS 121410 TaxID=1314787 RepID=A0A9P4I4H8_9PEZI|nr:hypothetical protein K490DRAFT_53440 [Saccharata proteae CBS 121410]